MRAPAQVQTIESPPVVRGLDRRVRRTCLGLSLLGMMLLTSVTSYGRPGSDAAAFLDAVRLQLTDLERDAEMVRDPKLRNRLEKRIRRMEELLARADHALVAPVGRPFQDVLEHLKQTAFDADRLVIIRDAARNGRFTATEARQLASTCTFDSTRVEALIALHPALVDPENFDEAMNVLTFASSKSEVQEALHAD